MYRMYQAYFRIAHEVLGMFYVLLFTDNADYTEARQCLMPAHLTFLEKHRHQIRAARPLREAADGAGAGGLWLVEPESHGAVDDLVHRDPFRILQWQRFLLTGNA